LVPAAEGGTTAIAVSIGPDLSLVSSGWAMRVAGKHRGMGGSVSGKDRNDFPDSIPPDTVVRQYV
jgi:hypothetical protein